MRRIWNAVLVCLLVSYFATPTFADNQLPPTPSSEITDQPTPSQTSARTSLMTCARHFLLPTAVMIASTVLITQSIAINKQHVVIVRQSQVIDRQNEHIDKLFEANQNIARALSGPDHGTRVRPKSIAETSADLTEAIEAAKESELTLVDQGAEDARSIRAKIVEHQKELIINLLVSVMTVHSEASIKSLSDFIEKTELSDKDKATIVAKGLFDGRLYWSVTLEVDHEGFVLKVRPPVEFEDDSISISI